VLELQSFMEATGFDHVGVFTYSHEEGTSGYALPDDVPAALKRKRQSRLMTVQKRLVARAQRARRGQQTRVLVDGPASEHELVIRARTEGQAPDIDPLVYLTDTDPSALAAGDLLTAQIVSSRGYDLVARPLLAPRPA
jgi:ribosomal protein S12 methylthiotransferase